MRSKILILLLFISCQKIEKIIPKQSIKDSLKIAYDLNDIESITYATILNQLQDSIITWHLIAATIQIESEFNPLAINPTSNCKGLMQLKESTAEYIAKKHNLNYKPNQTLFNPIHNITLGTLYLKQNLKSSGTLQQKLEHTIKCYVGGSKFKEKDPYTQYYKRKIMKEYNRLIYIEKGILCQFHQKN